jgi:hypothetical protein
MIQQPHRMSSCGFRTKFYVDLLLRKTNRKNSILKGYDDGVSGFVDFVHRPEF